MGVAGCGKSTLGKALANLHGIPYYDADDFHPEENVQKMKNGIPLTDVDRQQWLADIHTFTARQLELTDLVFACSALKQAYRDSLSDGLNAIWIYLEGDFDLIERRMKERAGHYMPPSLLRSQFETLEPPSDAITIPINITTDDQLERILNA